MHEHASLRRALDKREKNKFNSHQQQKFKKDPSKFGRNLFEKKISGDPEFSASEAYEHFRKTIVMRRERAHPAIARNEAPARTKIPFHSPTSKEILVIKRKGNGSSPRS
jgi:hypothetical protein